MYENYCNQFLMSIRQNWENIGYIELEEW